ncbi:Ger(x)C family spore germination protein [Clostridium omnivorum]|uniref:Germination protein GerKC n=1 Tax=Clostridium omnivorum TaxID=1604902 RepID=A0ABQ5N6H4_9CLOT|nr:Ger(x)C family spore germination protein [Clostridium sp. E14]GLC30852.1 germination protein GerKC [Clostridium sp. E14]
MKNFKYIITILLITTSTLFCSCSRDYNEIESRAFILGVGMDYDMVSKQFIVSAETVEGREGSVAAGAGSKVITGRGKSVFDAVRNMVTTYGKKLYWSHAKILIISGSLAENNIFEVLDWVNRDQEVRDDMRLLFTTKNTAQQILETRKDENTIVSNMIHDMMINQEAVSSFPKIDLWEFLYDMSTPGIEPIGALISLNPYEKGTLKIGGTAIFEDNKMKGELSPDQSKILLFIRNKIQGALFNIRKDQTKVGSNITFELFKSKTKLIPTYSNGSVAIIVDVNTNVGVAESSEDLDFTNNATVKQLERCLEAELVEEIQTLVSLVQKQYETDIFGFGREIEAHMPSEWSKLKNDWNKNFANLEVKANVHVTVNGSALVGKPLRKGD